MAKKISLKNLVRKTGMNSEVILREIRAKKLPAFYHLGVGDWLIKEKDFEKWEMKNQQSMSYIEK